MPKIQIVFSDVDNTLITSDFKVLPTVSSAVQAYVADGGVFVLASARPPKGVQALAQQLGCDSLMVCLNGALVLQNTEETAKTTTLFEKPMKADVLVRLEQIIAENQLSISVNAFSNQDWFSSSHDYWVKQEEDITQTTATIKSLTDQDRTMIEPLHKILCMGKPDAIDSLALLLDQEPALHLSYLRSKPTYLEIVDADISKMRAIREVAANFNIPLKNTMAIGDGENDLPMIENAGIGIAMGNGIPLVKQVATHTVASNDQGGVAEALKKYTGTIPE